MKNIILLSTKRSTHHAFLEGILNGREYKYWNNVQSSSGGSIKFGDIVSSGLETIKVCSFEMNYDPSKLFFNEKYSGFLKGFENPSKIIYIRDPLNTLASAYSVYLKRLSDNPEFSFSWLENVRQQWKSLASLAIDNSTQCSGFIFVYANYYWSNVSYRKSINSELGAEFSSKIEHVSTFAKGGHTYFSKKDVSYESLIERFKVFKEAPDFINLLKDEDFLNTVRLFNHLVIDPVIDEGLKELELI